MIVRTLEGLAVATRFDLIRRAFLAEPIGNAVADPEIVRAPMATAAWTLVRADASSDDPARGIDRLDTEGCWQAAPNAGRRSVDVELETATAGRLTIVFAPTCGGLPDSAHLQRQVRDGWTQVADCPLGDSTARCPPRSASGERLRLVLVARDGRRIGIESIRLDTDG